jgi:hypothetical protein
MIIVCVGRTCICTRFGMLPESAAAKENDEDDNPNYSDGCNNDNSDISG